MVTAATQSMLQELRRSSSNRKSIEASLFRLRVVDLKELCRELAVSSGGNKSTLCGRIISYWQTGLFQPQSSASVAPSPTSSVLTPSISRHLQQLGPLSSYDGSWAKDLSLLSDFTFMDLFVYLVESSDKTYDQCSMRAFKSLKAYRYFADGYVQNAWVTEATPDLLVVRCYCFSSLKSSKTYPVFVCLGRNGDVYSAECKCVAG